MNKKEYHKTWYEKNKKKRRAEITQNKQEIVNWFKSYKKTLSCSRCIESHVACLDFHHVDSNVKEINIASAVRRGWSITRIIKEIDKCIVLCSNCHRKEHYTE